MSTLTPHHVVPIDHPGVHQASTFCRCDPVATFRDLGTGAPVYRHRSPMTTRSVDCVDKRAHAGSHLFLAARGWECPRCHPERLP